MPASSAKPDIPLAADPAAGVGLYIHWPYCERICPYCDFNVRLARDVDDDRWRRAFHAEMSHIARLRGAGAAALTSIYFGGGTPSLMKPALVATIIEDAETVFGLADDAEITLEANPTSSEATRFEAFAAAGVNRLSLGIQAFDDDALRFLGRDHTGDEATAALEQAQTAFPRTSFDLIYGLPRQSADQWQAALSEALECASGHVSLYQLTVETGTAFGAARRRGTLVPPDEDTLADLYEVTQSVTADAGLEAYEVSNHATPGHEGRHNLTYWRYGEYVGIGPGAHGRLVLDGARVATEGVRNPERWLTAVERQGHGIGEHNALDAAACGTELLLMNLRLKEGISARRFAAVCGVTLAEAACELRVAAMIENGLLSVDDARMAATEKGRPILNALVAGVIDALSW